MAVNFTINAIYPTLSQVYAAMRELCGEYEVTGGQRFTDAICHTFLRTAYWRLTQAFLTRDLELTGREIYGILPANQSHLFPENFAIFQQGIGELHHVHARRFSAADKIAISSLALNSSDPTRHLLTCTLASAATWGSGATVTLAGNIESGLTIGTGGAELMGEWAVEVPTSTTIRIAIRPGLAGVASYASGDAYALYSGEIWTPVDHQRALRTGRGVADAVSSPSSNLGAVIPPYYHWNGRALVFPAVAADVQIKAIAQVSRVLPGWADVSGKTTTFRIFIPGCDTFLAYYGAGLMIANDNPAQSMDLLRQAAGDSPLEDGAIGGFLEMLLSPYINEEQGLRGPVQRPSWRERRGSRRSGPFGQSPGASALV